MTNLINNLKSASLKDAFFLIFLSGLTLYFLDINSDILAGNALIDSLAFFTIVGAFFFSWAFFLSGHVEPLKALKYAQLSLSPFLVLLLLIPYSFFYAHLEGLQPLVCLIILGLGSLIFNAILTNVRMPALSLFSLTILLIIYTFFFSAISVLRHLNYQNASSFDVAIYSQIQWSNIHGRFFHTSFSGSNFVTHNSPFLILLSPFYAIYPHPSTLLVLKTFFIAFSVVPFYLIAQNYVRNECLWPLMLGYLFFPFIVGQNFNAPHETCFLPPLLLLTFYFYIKNYFKPFLIFLLLSLSIKEHMAMIAVMFGIYSFFLKKEKPWTIIPLLLGIAWAIMSMWIIYHFQKIYHVDPYPAWLIENIERRFLRPGHPLWSNVLWGLQTSILGHWSNLISIYSLLAPVCLVLPFFSSIWILGLPELGINLLATIPLTYPTWHYNIVVSIFLLLSCVGAIKKSPPRTQELLSWLLCICILSHFFLWSDYLYIKNNPHYVHTMDSAIGLIPMDSSVSLTKHLVAYVSDRKDYFLCEDKRKGDYIVLDKGERMADCLNPDQVGHYTNIFQQDGIRVYKKEY